MMSSGVSIAQVIVPVRPTQPSQRIPYPIPAQPKAPDAAKPTAPPPIDDATKAPPPVAPGEPPEEDPGQVARVYTFNPLQAKKEITAGDFYKKRGNYKAAASRYFEATQWDDGSADAFYKLGEAQEKLQQYPEAKEAFTKFASLTPDKKEAANIQKRIAKYPSAKPAK